MAGGVLIHSASIHRFHTLLPDVWSEDEDKVARVEKRYHTVAKRGSLRSPLIE